MYSADQARADLPEARLARFERAIKHAVEEGEPLCHVRLRAKPEDIRYLEEHGYTVKVDGGGVTWIYWFAK
jgi:hypothetical protein